MYNQKLSFGELKEHLGNNITGIRPKSLREVLNKGVRTVVSNGNPDVADSTLLQVFEDGTVYYRADGKETMFSISECGNYEYRFSDGTVYRLTNEYILELEWHICLALYAEDKILRNALSHKKEILFSSLDHEKLDSEIEDKSANLWNCYIRDYWRKEDETDLVNEAVSILCEMDRTIFGLYYLAGYSQTEIASKIGLSRESVCRRMKRALNKIQRICR